MAIKKLSAFARLTAGAVAVAVGMLGFAAGTAKAADPGNIDVDASTSLTIHKFVTPNPVWTTKNDGNPITVPAGATPLKGVQFSVTPVTQKGAAAIDLTTPAGWDLIQGATPAVVQGAGWTLGASQTLTTDASGNASATLPKGLYLVKEVGHGDNQITAPVADFLVTLPYPDAANNKWIYNVHVYPKNDVSTDKVTKKSNDPDKVTQPATVKWDVNIPVASGPFTKFVVTDAIDSRLTYVSATVKQGSTTFVEGTDYNVTGNAVITFTTTGLGKLANNVPVKIEYTTTVKDGSLGVIKNFVNVEINDYKTSTDPSNPNFPGGPQTPTIPDPNCTQEPCQQVPNPNYPPVPSTNWGKLEILKHVAGSEATVLDGAEFGVYSDAAAMTQVGTITTITNGVGSLNLWVGNDSVVAKDYWIKETKAPAGYVLDSTITKVTVVAGADATASTVQQKVANTKQTGPGLPITGSAGQQSMLIGGLVLMLVGGGLVLRRRVRA